MATGCDTAQLTQCTDYTNLTELSCLCKHACVQKDVVNGNTTGFMVEANPEINIWVA